MSRTKNRAAAALAFRSIGFIISTAGIIMHLLSDNMAGAEFMVRHKLAYFTIETNVFISLMFLYLSVRGIMLMRKGSSADPARMNQSLKLALTFYITITMLGFWLLLAPATGIPKSNGFLLLNTLTLHLITPLLAIADELLFCPHGGLGKKDALLWLSYPVAYVIFVMIYSRFITEPYYSFMFRGSRLALMYPYPFLDSAVMGRWGVPAAIALLALLFTLLSLGFIWLDGLIARREKRK